MPTADEYVQALDPFAAAALRQRRRYPTREPSPEALAASQGKVGWGDLAAHKAEKLATLPQRVTEAASTVPYSDEYDPGPAMETAGWMAGSRIPFMGPGEVGMFGGPASRTANLDKLKKAQEIYAEGQHRLENATFSELERKQYPRISDRWMIPAYNETGWFKGPTDEWRYVIPDEGAKVGERGMKRLLDRYDRETTLPEIFHHPSLYEAYPILKDVSVTEHTGPWGALHWPSPERPGTGKIELSLKHPKQLGSLAHETQHSIQEVESPAPSVTHPNWYKNLMRRYADEKGLTKTVGDDELESAIDRAAYNLYLRHGREVEATNADYRLNAFNELPVTMWPHEYLPWSTERIPRADVFNPVPEVSESWPSAIDYLLKAMRKPK